MTDCCGTIQSYYDIFAKVLYCISQYYIFRGSDGAVSHNHVRGLAFKVCAICQDNNMSGQ